MGLSAMWGKRLAGIAGAAGVMLVTAQAAQADPPPDADELHALPIAAGRYTSNAQGDFYHVYFKTPDGRFCGILPNGGPVGCDAAPHDAPAGSNQTVVNSWGPAEYEHSDEPSFTRDVDVLPEGYRLENWGASCGIRQTGTVTCTTYGQHGFTISALYGELW
jgi:hypothetical protein